jgi:hypothetical protein
MARNLSQQSVSQSAIPASPAQSGRKRPATKQATMLKLLRRTRSASMADLMTATGWQAHSVRAALSGLRKRDIAILRKRKDGVTRYRISKQ